jgi:hypothetical protein
VNRAMPSGDRGHRDGTNRRPSRRGRLGPRALRLVGGATPPPERKTPPGGNPAARWMRRCGSSALHGIAALPVLALRGRHGQPHLFADRPREEAANRMFLPARQLHQFLERRAVRSLQQVQDLGGLAAVAGGNGALLAPRCRFLGLGRFFAGLAFLLALAFLGATWAPFLATAAFLVGLGLVGFG